jgi:hypothetical protein
LLVAQQNPPKQTQSSYSEQDPDDFVHESEYIEPEGLTVPGGQEVHVPK